MWKRSRDLEPSEKRPVEREATRPEVLFRPDVDIVELEGVRRHVWRHAHAVVPQHQAGALLAFGRGHDPREDLDASARRHGVSRVHREVDEHLLEQAPLGHHHRVAGLEPQDDLDVLADHAAHDGLGVAHHAIEHHGLGAMCRPAPG